MSETASNICRVTRLTPHGRGAVAVVVVEGAAAVELVEKHFVAAAGKSLTTFPVNRIIFGRWCANANDGEEIVVCRTSETSVELNCHGGVTAAQAIINALVADGAIEQAASLWAVNNSSDSIEAEALLALGDARTERAAAILLDQYRGALREAVEKTINDLKNHDSNSARQRLLGLLRRSEIGLHLTNPWRVVFAGPPNVGKSSLMNRLLGYDRSIVFDQPGTTRDLLTASAAFDGWSVELTDTAGLRESEDAIEVAGVSRATDTLSTADLAVLVFDATCEMDETLDRLLTQHPHAIYVINKCDLRSIEHLGEKFLLTSAVNGAGITELMDRIVSQLVRCDVSPGDAVPFNERQLTAIDSARRAVDTGNAVGAIDELQALLLDSKVAI